MSLYLPLEKGMGLYLYGMAIHAFVQTRSLFSQRYFLSSLVEIGQVFLENKMNMRKVYRQIGINEQEVIRKALDISAQMS